MRTPYKKSIIIFILILFFSIACQITKTSVPTSQYTSTVNAPTDERLSTSTVTTPQFTATWENGKRPAISQSNYRQVNLIGMIEGEVFGMAWSPDGKTLAVARERSIVFYDAESKIEIRSIDQSGISGLSFSPDGELLAFDTGSSVEVWNLENDQSQLSLDWPNNSPLFSPDGKLLIVRNDYSLLQYTVNDFSVPPRSFGEQGEIYVDGMSFSPDGTQLATLYRDSTLRIWNMSDLNLVVSRQLEDVSGRVSGIVWNPLGNSIAAMGSDVTLLDPSTLESLSIISSVVTNSSGLMAFNPQGTILALPDWNYSFNLWDVSGKDSYPYYIVVPKVKEEFENIRSIAFNPNGDLLAVGTCNSGGLKEYGAVWIYGLGVPLSTPTALPSDTPEPTSTPTATMLPGLKLFLDEDDRLTLQGPSSNSASYTDCLYGNCTQTWSITLNQAIQGTQFGFDIHSGLDISIIWTHDGQDTLLAEWKNTESYFGMKSGASLQAESGDIITLTITCLQAGRYYWWSYGNNSYITILE